MFRRVVAEDPVRFVRRDGRNKGLLVLTLARCKFGSAAIHVTGQPRRHDAASRSGCSSAERFEECSREVASHRSALLFFGLVSEILKFGSVRLESDYGTRVFGGL